ncbi:nitroreductase family protein [Pseudodesulfovibrio sp.]|uniref:nitroreductase family protein n=1 Tax=unclassified Pseudodesulfovibrio TaxID=2661612 RepID=UPI003B007499
MQINDNPVIQAMLDRRSIRKYTDEPVTDQQLTTILEAGRWAPSGMNYQPWRFLVVKKNDPRTEKLGECTKYTHIVRGAAACIAVLLDKDVIYSEMKDHQGVGACIQNMLLAIHALGLGAVWLGQIINDQEAALGALALSPGKYELEAVITLGHPAQKGSSDRKPLSELLLEAL